MAKILVLPHLNLPYVRANIVGTSILTCLALIVLIPFAMMLYDIIVAGLPHVSWEFLTELPRMSGRKGGIAPILVSTFLILLVTLAVVIPFGLATAILLSEVTRQKNPLAKFISLSLDILAGVPSIVFGLFGNAFFCVYLGLGFSIWAGGLTLACMALPLFVRAAELGLSTVPDDWRRGGVALGLSGTALLRHILLPVAAPAIALGAVFSTGRALAETAALIFTSGYVDRMPSSLMDSGRALAVHIYDLTMNIPGGEHNAYATVLVLIGLIGLINGITYWLTEKFFARRVIQS